MNPSLRLGSLAVLLAASALGVQAQTATPAPAPSPAVRAEKNMSLELANEIAGAAVAACAANGYAVAATVVDRAGTVRAVQALVGLRLGGGRRHLGRRRSGQAGGEQRQSEGHGLHGINPARP